MNHIYRIVWNAALGACVAVAENAKGTGKTGSARSRVVTDVVGSAGFTLKPACRAALVLFAAAALLTPQVHAANAADAVVSSGGGSVATSGATTTITQASQRLAIDWTSLSTAAGEALVFKQPNAQAIALNRITGASPSEFLGSLTANGQVFILNPNGVLFGAGSQVNVGGLVASTLSMSNADFEAGNFKFSGSGTASVVNQGTLTAANGGYIALLAPEVRNEGVIGATLGTALLAAGNKVTLNLDNGSLLGYSIDQAAVNALADNRHLIKADGGQVILTASATDALLRTVVNNSGVIEANTLSNRGGMIRLEGGDSGVVHVSGTLDASGKGAGERGGRVEVTGNKVGLFDGARVDVSGDAGGGTALLGGDYQGGNAAVRNASATYVGAGVRVTADAITRGDGGKVIVWSDDTTRYYGGISAKGGANSGDGGFVEVSGKHTLVFKGKVDTRAAHGKTGMLLLDPTNIIIADGAGDSLDDGLDVANSAFAGDPSGVVGTVAATDAATAGAGNLTLYESELEGIAATTNISLAATNNITINDLTDNNLNLAQSSGNSVTFSAATFSMNAGDTITTAGGAININTTAGATVGGLASNGGAVTLNVGGASSVNGIISGVGTSLIKEGNGTLTLNGANTYTGDTDINAGSLALGAANRISDASAVTVGLGATFDLNDYAETVGSISGLGDISLGATGFPGIAKLTAGGNNTTTTFAGSISGAGGMTKVGSGTLTLSGDSSYTGFTRISQGTLALDATGKNESSAQIINNSNFSIAGDKTIAGLLGNGTTQLGANTLTINIANGNQQTYTGVASGTGGITKAGGGVFSLVGANTYTGITTVSAGELRIGEFGSTGSVAGDIVNNATLSFTRDNPLTYSGVISGTGAVNQYGSGALTLGGVNTYTGLTWVANELILNATGSIAASSEVKVDGILRIADSKTIARLTGSSGASSVQLGSNASTTLTVGDASNFNSDFSGWMGGAGGVTKAGTGTLVLGGDNTYTGATTISDGTLTLSAGGKIEASSGVANNGTFSILGNKTIDSLTGSGATQLGTNTLTIGDASNTSSTYSGVASGSGGITKAGSGELTLSGANTYTGATTINGGTLKLGAAGVIADSSRLIVGAGATFDVNDFAETVGSIEGAGNISLGVGGYPNSPKLTAGGNNTDTTFAGVISGDGRFTKAGTGTLTLSGVNTHVGFMGVEGGTLALDATGTVATSAAVAIATGGTFSIAADKSIIAIDGAGAMQLGGILSINGNGYIHTYNGVASGAGGIHLAGAGSTLNLGGNSLYTGATTISAGTLKLSASGSIAGSSGVANNGTFVVEGDKTIDSMTGTGGTQLNSYTLTIGDASNTSSTYNGNISGAGNLTKAGAGTLTLGGNNTYTGATHISAGTLALGAAGSIAASSGVSNSGVLSLLGHKTIDSMTGTGATQLGAYTLTIGDTSNSSSTYSGVISGLGGITKAGAGTLTLSGNNTYTGATDIDVGTLVAAHNNALGHVGGGTTVANGATLALQGDITISEAVMYLKGNGVSNGGALQNLSGNNTLAGGVELVLATRISSAGGTGNSLTLSGADLINTAGLTVAGAGDTTISKKITGAGALNKEGSRALTLTADNTYTGGTSVSGGSLFIGGNTTTGSVVGNIDVNNGSLIFARSNDLSYSGIISGNGMVRQAGAGMLTLGGANSYTGTTSIDAGTLVLDATGTIAASSGVFNNGTLRVEGDKTIDSLMGTGATQLGANTLTIGDASNTDSDYSGIISGTGRITKEGTGTLTLRGANDYTGGTSILAGTLKLGASGVLSDTSAITVDAAGTFDLAGFSETVGSIGGSGNIKLGDATVGSSILTTGGNQPVATVDFSGVASGTGGITKVGTGTLNLGGANTYTGDTTVSAGTLQIGGDGGNAGAGEVPGNIVNNASLVFNRSNDLTYAGAISGTGAVTKQNAGTLVFTGANTYEGGTIVNGGILQIGDNGTTGSITGDIVNNASNVTFNRSDSLTYHGVMSGTGSLTKLGAGTLSLSGNNTYTGVTSISEGTLLAGAFGAISDTSEVRIFTGATYDLNGLDETVASISGDVFGGGGGTIKLGTATLTTGGNGLDSSFGGVISSITTEIGGIYYSGGITKVGAGELTLGGANTYAGATTINGGSLKLGAAGVISDASALVIGTNGTFNLNDFSETVKSIVGTGNISLGSANLTTDGSGGTYSGVISGTGSLTKAGTGALTLTGANTYTGGTTVSGGLLDISNINGGNGSVVGNIENNGAVRFNLDTDLTYGGVMSGTGELRKSRFGMLTLTGANTYTGGTTVNGGTLSIGNGGTVGSVTGNIANSGNVTFNRSDAVTYADVISGAGSFTKAGTGHLTLTADNTYTGLTTVSDGSLRLGNGGTAGLVAGDISIDSMIADVTFNHSGEKTYAGVISGAGAVAKNGVGTLTLSGNNTYAGLTNINAGTLVAGHANALGAVGGGTYVVAGATLNVDNVALAESAITISGNGAGGAGALVGTGAATVTGTVTTAGSSLIGTGSASSVLSLTGAVTASHNLGIVGSGNLTALNTANDFSAVSITGARDVSLVDQNALTLNASSVRTLSARTLSGDLTLNGDISATGTGSGTSIQLMAAGNFLDPNNSTLTPGTGSRWLVYSTTPTADTRGANLLSAYDFKQYNATVGDVIFGTGNGFIYTTAPVITAALTGSAGKTYDGDTTVPIGSLGLSGATGAIDGDTVTLTGLASATYDTQHAGTGKTVSVSGISIGSQANGAKAVYGYALASSTATAAVGTVTQRAITVTAATDTKTYDGNTSSAGAPTVTAGSVVSGDAGGFTQTFDDKNAGTGKTLTATGAVADGNGGNNYAVTFAANNTGVINQLAIVGSIAGHDKVYDGDTTATIGSRFLTGVLGSDAVTYTGGTASFDNKNAGIAKTVTATGLSLTGADAGNYSVNSTATSTNDIDRAALTVSGITADSKVYDQTASATVNTGSAVYSGLVSGDVLAVSATGVFTDKNAANGKTVYLTSSYSGADVGNYAITEQATTMADITPKALTVSGITADNKTYNASTAATVNAGGAVYSGLISGDVLAVTATGVFADKNVGIGKTVNLSSSYSGADAGNYAITDQAITHASISQASLAITGVTAQDRTYDATRVATLGGTAAVTAFAGDVVNVSGAGAGLFADKNVGTGKAVAVTGFTLSGTDAGNYALEQPTGVAANIAQAALTVSGITAADKTYNANDAATVNTAGASYSGLFGGDVVTVAATGLFSDKNAANNKTVSLSSSYTGADVGNYAIADQATTTASISQATLTVSGITADNKTYNANDAATVNTAGASYSGLFGGDIVSVAATGLFSDKNAASNKTVTLSSSYTGADVGNYAITDQATTTASISQATLTVTGITAADKTYNANDAATVNTAGASYSGLFGGDVVTVAATGLFSDKNAASNKTVTLSSSYSGADVGNYVITDQATTTASISQASLTISATGTHKVYDGNTTATVVYGDNRFAGDVLSFGGNAAFADKNAATGIAVAVSGLTVSGADAGNYVLTASTASTHADITPKQLTVSANDDTRLSGGGAYSGGNGVSYSGFVAGETVADLGGALSYGGSSQGTSAAGSYAITPGGYSASNYALTYLDGVLTIGLPAAVPVVTSGATPVGDAYASALTSIGGMGASQGGSGDDAGALAAAAAETDDTDGE